MLVKIGDNRRVVSFSSTPGSTDAEALTKAIKETFRDVLIRPNQELLIQVLKSDFKEWGEVFIDVLDKEIEDKSVINVLLKPIQEVSHYVYVYFLKEIICCILFSYRPRIQCPLPEPLVVKFPNHLQQLYCQVLDQV